MVIFSGESPVPQPDEQESGFSGQAVGCETASQRSETFISQDGGLELRHSFHVNQSRQFESHDRRLSTRA